MDTGDLIEAVRAHRVVELRYGGRGARVLDVRFEPDPEFNRGSERYQHGLLACA
jgi:hypothetical protein